MSIPTQAVTVPDAISKRYGTELICLWENLLGGVTFQAGEQVIKWSPWNEEITLSQEVKRTRWAKQYVPAPEILDYGSDDDGEWIVTRTISASTAVAPQWLARPGPAVIEIGRALRYFHDTVAVETCAWRWDAESRLLGLEQRGINPGNLRDVPTSSRTVVCHGDPCSPNFLLDPKGNLAAYVDLGEVGVGDMWADLAVAAQNAVQNFGPGADTILVRAYGAEPDRVALRYYQELWNAE